MIPGGAAAGAVPYVLLLGCLVAGCVGPAQRAGPDGTTNASRADSPVEFIDGATLYVPVTYVSRMPFIVLDVDTTGAKDFDYQLRDDLQKLGFPRGITQAQLAKVYVDAGLAETTPSTGDPMAMRRLSDVVGPFVRLRVDYQLSGFGLCNYELELWDVRSASPVLQLKGSRIIWWNLSKELSPDIAKVLAQWREDSLRAEKDEEANRGAPVPRT
jgi:hypothetical protein